jgi:RHS repeat-associated protein
MTRYRQDVFNVGDEVKYTYDTANRPSTVTDSTGTFSIQSDADGRPSQITYPLTSGVVGSYDYSKSGKPQTIAYTKAGTGNLLTYKYDYKDGSKQTDRLQSEKVTGSTTALTGNLTYKYTKSGQLQSAGNDNGDDYTYAYDKAGNLTKATTNDASSSTYNGYDRAGQLCWTGTATTAPSTQLGTSCPSTPSGYTAHTSDDAGNDLGTSTSTNSYNANSQATTVGGVAQDYLDLGNDLRITSGSKTTISGPLGLTAQINASDGVTFYTRDPGGTILGAHGYGGTHYYLADYQGSVSALTSSTGTIEGTYSYDPYGKTSVKAENGSSAAGNNPWRYTGGYQDLEGAGYYHLNARYYDSAGHFNQPDSLQGAMSDPKTLNSYGYTSGDPVNRVDPSGRTSFRCGVTGVAWAVGGALVGGTVGEVLGGPPGAAAGAAFTAAASGSFMMGACGSDAKSTGGVLRDGGDAVLDNWLIEGSAVLGYAAYNWLNPATS